MNKIGGNAIRIKLTNLHTALKKLADKHHPKVSHQLELDILLEINNIYSTKAVAFVLFVHFILC